MNIITKNFGELTTVELYEILKARAEIFIMEQNTNYQDMDDIDYKSLQAIKEKLPWSRMFNNRPANTDCITGQDGMNR